MKKLKNEKGVTGIDISIATIVILLFVSIIASLIYSFSEASKGIERKSEATHLAIQIIENIKQMNYEDVMEDKNGGINLEYIKQKTGQEIDALSGYNITINVENYKDKMQDDTLEDVIKIVKVTIDYTLGKDTQTVDITTALTKEE